jgi:hypothetical protein
MLYIFFLCKLCKLCKIIPSFAASIPSTRSAVLHVLCFAVSCHSAFQTVELLLADCHYSYRDSYITFNAVPAQLASDSGKARPRVVPPPTPVRFPNCLPQTADRAYGEKKQPPLVSLLRHIQRPADVKVEHLQALGLHVIPDAPTSEVVPDRSYLPPSEWVSVSVEDVEDINPSTMRPLNNGRDSPGVKTYLERIKELSIPNEAAFRTIRRQPAPPGEQNARLGNAYELFKYLELLAGFWIDTSRPPLDPDAMDVDPAPEVDLSKDGTVRIGTGSQTPPDFRNSLLSALTKLVAYDFGCNVSLPRIEPRLYISSPASSNTSSTTSSFPTNISFIYRTPTVRASARSGIVEGPLAALSSRPTTGFTSPHDSVFDLCREVASILVTAQQRSRETKTEKKLLDDLWWCHKPRWGGGPGGPIGREAAKVDETGSVDGESMSAAAGDGGESSTGPSPAKKSRKKMTLYDNYRMVRPPSSTWDRKTKYMAIGKPKGAEYDDVFLMSCLNHHVSVVRMRVPMSLLDELEGERVLPKGEVREKCVMWRSRWFDMFLVGDRVEAMTCIWGMMAYMMRKVDEGEGGRSGGGGGGKDAE